MHQIIMLYTLNLHHIICQLYLSKAGKCIMNLNEKCKTIKCLEKRKHLESAAAKSLQSCLTLCDPRDVSPPGFPSLGFSRQEHWSGLPFPSPMHESEKVKVKSLSRVRLLATPWIAAHQAPPSMGFSRQECWSGVPLPSPIGI